jgi:UDP-N-acetylglucosamine 4,6-dehydratase/5-epimerase
MFAADRLCFSRCSLSRNYRGPRTMMRGSVLITGGTGAFGTAFTRYLLTHHPDVTRIVIYSRNEFNQFLMAKSLDKYAHRLRFMIGDVRDKERFHRSLFGIDFVIHAAALKRIEVGHYNPDEMIKTNVDGSKNVVEAILDWHRPIKAILLSSDKAWQPISPYGISKAMAEALFINANNMRGENGPMFAVCRYGNVWNSTGSVVPKWRALIANSEPIEITDPDCTRFYMTMDEAIALVVDTYYTMRGDSKLRIPTLPAYQLGDLAVAMGATKRTITGLPPWEKLHEGMADGNTSDKARRMTIAELKAALNER